MNDLELINLLESVAELNDRVADFVAEAARAHGGEHAAQHEACFRNAAALAKCYAATIATENVMKELDKARVEREAG